MRNSFFATSALTAICIAGTAVAQDAPIATPTAVDGQEDATAQQGLQDIVVTAQRREESLQRAGIAIDVVSGDELVSQGLTSSARPRQARTVAERPVGRRRQHDLLPARRRQLHRQRLQRSGDRVQLRRRLSRPPDLDIGRVLRSRAARGAQGAAGHALRPQRDRRRDQHHARASPRPASSRASSTGSYGNYNALNLAGRDQPADGR